MTPELREDITCWFVLNHIATTFQEQAKKTVDRFNRANGATLELFAPTYVVRETKNGEVRMKSINLTFHYVFVRGTLQQVKQLCCMSNGFSFLIDRGSKERYAMIPDHDMANFKNIARAYRNCLPYFSLEDIDLEDGDIVEVVNGDFPGLVGTYIPKPKSNSGDIVLNIYNKVGTIAFNVRATDVRVIEFSRKCTRANDQIDAFVPHLMKAMRLFHANESLSSPVLARLSVFCRRMEIVKLNNRKLNAKLQALLYAANHILGNITAAETAKAKYEKLSSSITNEWTSALIALIFHVISSDSAQLDLAIASLGKLTPASKAQQMLVEEFNHYNA